MLLPACSEVVVLRKARMGKPLHFSKPLPLLSSWRFLYYCLPGQKIMVGKFFEMHHTPTRYY